MDELVLYVGNFFYPRGNAAGKRVYGNIKAIQEAGFQTACLAFSKAETCVGLQKSRHDGTEVYEIPYCLGFKRMNNTVPYRHFLTAMQELQETYQIHAVIMYSTLGNTGFNKKVITYCKRNKIRVLYDLADWFDQQDRNNMFRYVIKSWDLQQLEKKVLPGCDTWITISHFLKKRMPDPDKVLVIPPLATELESALPCADPTVTTFAYASFVTDKNRPVSEWKDRIDTMVDAFYHILTVHKRRDFRVKFIGFEKQALLDMFTDEWRDEYAKKLDILADNIIFIGPRSNEEVAKELRTADFTMLIRDSKTCTNAGFATKVSESVSLGIPVLVNDTSDVALYIKDGENGFILPPPSDLASIAESMLRCMDMPLADKELMKTKSKASQVFYYKNFIKSFESFLQTNEI